MLLCAGRLPRRALRLVRLQLRRETTCGRAFDLNHAGAFRNMTDCPLLHHLLPSMRKLG